MLHVSFSEIGFIRSYKKQVPNGSTPDGSIDVDGTTPEMPETPEAKLRRYVRGTVEARLDISCT